MERSPSGYISRLSLLACLLAALLFSGCLARGLHGDEEDDGPMPDNALEAAYAWPGDKTMFVTGDGSPLLKLRDRRTGYKVFDGDLLPIGHVRREGESVLIWRLDQRSGMVIQKTEEATFAVYSFTGSLPEIRRPDPEKQTEKTTVRLPEDAEVIARLARRDANGGCPTWRLFDADGKLMAEMVSWRGDGEKTNEADCLAPDTTWKLITWAPDGDARRAWKLAAGKKDGRSAIEATSLRDDAEEGASGLALRVITEEISPLACAPVLMQHVDPLLRAGLMTLLKDQHTPE